MQLFRCKLCGYKSIEIDTAQINARRYYGYIGCDNWRCRKVYVMKYARTKEKALRRAEAAWNRANDPNDL